MHQDGTPFPEMAHQTDEWGAVIARLPRSGDRSGGRLCRLGHSDQNHRNALYACALLCDVFYCGPKWRLVSVLRSLPVQQREMDSWRASGLAAARSAAHTPPPTGNGIGADLMGFRQGAVGEAGKCDCSCDQGKAREYCAGYFHSGFLFEIAGHC